MVMSKPGKLQEVLDQIQELCLSHGVHWRLEKIIGDEDGARIRVAYVKEENKIQHLNELMGMPRKSGSPDPVEAEAVLTISSHEGRFKPEGFEITKDDGTTVLEHIKAELGAVIHGRGAENAHEMRE
jgi:hypothetical protein